MQAGAFEAYARNGEKNVIMFDTTWGTNRYGMKLGFFTTVGVNGETVILAGVLIMHETKASFEWAFERFKKCFKIPPAIIITDGDICIIGACESTLPDTIRLTCVWHLSLNFTTHIRPVLCFNWDTWCAVLNAWWRLAKQTDESARATFDADFQKIVDVVAALKPNVADARATAKHVAVLKWLEWLRSVKKTWAACYTWSMCTLGVHSTQVRARVLPSERCMLLLCVLLLSTPPFREAKLTSRTATCNVRHFCGAASRAALRVDPRRHQAAPDQQHAPH